MTQIKIDKLVRTKRKTIALIVDNKARLIVRAPLRASMHYIENLIRQKENWIKEKQEETRRKNETHKPIEFKDGDTMYYLGVSYRITYKDNVDFSYQFIDGQFIINAEFEKYAKAFIIFWYKKTASKVFNEKVKHYSELLGLKFNRVKISNAKTRWGSCSTNGNLNFSWRIVMAPQLVIDYIVVHELAHTIEMNHSQKFWNTVKRIYPDYKLAKKWLKENSHTLET